MEKEEMKQKELTFTLKVRDEVFINEDGEQIKYLDCFILYDGEKIRFYPISKHKDLFKFICKNIK